MLGNLRVDYSHKKSLTVFDSRVPQNMAEMWAADACMYIQKKYIYIYIYMAITSISGPKKGHIFNFPQFRSKDDPEKHPHLVRGFFTFQCFVFFLMFAFSCLSFSSFPLLLDFSKPESGPSNEVIGSIYIYIHTYML